MYKIIERSGFTYGICDDQSLLNLISYREFYGCGYAKGFLSEYKNTGLGDWWCVVLDNASKELREKIRRTVEISYEQKIKALDFN